MKVIRRNRRQKENKRKNIIIAVAIFLAVAVIFFGGFWAFRQLSVPRFILSDKTEELIGCEMKNGETSKCDVAVGDIRKLEFADDVDVKQLDFVSSNEDIIRVDSGGRIDAVKEGVASVSAKGLGFEGTCEFTVSAEKSAVPTEITSAITANLSIIEKNKENGENGLYRITVNRRTNVTTVYTYDEKGEYLVPVRAMVSSCGAGGSDITPTGTFSIYFKERWHELFGDCFGQYVSGFNNEYLFHSVPYYTASADDLETEEYNKLSTNASQGCVRLSVSDAKWIYDNCPLDTQVEVIDKDEKFDALGTPSSIKIDESIGWDPTDPDENNPLLKNEPKISGAKDIVINKGDEFKPLENITATDTCKNDITDKIEMYQNVFPDKKGTYYLTYYVKDALNKTAKETIKVTVK